VNFTVIFRTVSRGTPRASPNYSAPRRLNENSILPSRSSDTDNVNVLCLCTNLQWRVSGRVVDASGAVIVDAAVTLINQATGDTRAAQTDKAGTFVFVAVQPGTFTVIVTVPKFKTLEKRDIKLSASERLSAGELKLEVGGISGEAVTVTAGTATIQTQSAERSSVVDSQDLSTLMSIGRDVLALTRLLPESLRTKEARAWGRRAQERRRCPREQQCSQRRRGAGQSQRRWK